MNKIALAILLLALGASPSSAIILFGHDNSTNITDPANGIPWKNVAKMEIGAGVTSGSGVYLGNQFLITANHVAVDRVVIDGHTFLVDTTFSSGGFVAGQRQVSSADLKILRLVSDPFDTISGLSTITLNASTSLDLNRASYLVGYGAGKGTESPSEGWAWDASTAGVQRWGTNTTENYTVNVGAHPNITVSLTTAFDAGPADEAALAINDSGSALFQFISGQWRLSGIGFAVEVAGSSFYNRTSGSIFGDERDHSFFARIAHYKTDIDAILAIPEPSTWALLTLSAGAGILAWRTRRRRPTPAQRGA